MPCNGYEFLGWSGDPECQDGELYVTRDISCTAIFGDYDLGGKGLVAYWPFDGHAIDATVNGHDGVVQGASWTTGYLGAALEFHHLTTSAVSIPRSVFDGFGNTAYFEAWIYPTGLPVRGSVIFGKRAAYNDWNVILWHDGRINTAIYGYVGTGGTNGWQAVGVQSPDPVPLNTWSKVSTWYDGETITLSINGVEGSSRLWDSISPKNLRPAKTTFAVSKR